MQAVEAREEQNRRALLSPLRPLRNQGRRRENKDSRIEMTDPVKPGSLCSEHFALQCDYNAFGMTFHLPEREYLKNLLFQPRNAWAEQHWGQSQIDNNHRALLLMLEAAYVKGHRDALQQARKALGING